MASGFLAHHQSVPARETFYVVKRNGSAAAPGMVTVLNGVPAGAEELGAFDNPSRAIDFAESVVRELNGTGSVIEMVDPPYGLVGGG